MLYGKVWDKTRIVNNGSFIFEFDVLVFFKKFYNISIKILTEFSCFNKHIYMFYVKNIISYAVLMLSMSFCSFGYAFDRIKNEKDVVSKKAGVIYLIGEKHDDKDDIKQKSLLKEAAEKDKILLALEGEVEDFGGTLFGLDELNMLSIGNSLNSLIDLYRHMLYKKIVDTVGVAMIDEDLISKEGYSEMFSNPRYTLSCYLKLISSYLKTAVHEKHDPKEIKFFQSQIQSNKLFGVFLKYKLGKDPAIMDFIGENSIDDNFYDNMSDGCQNWYVLLRRIATYWQRELGASSSIMSEALLATLEDIIVTLDKLYSDIDDFHTEFELGIIMDKLGDINTEIVERISLGLRNDIFLFRICSAYEKTKNSNKPFFVVIGNRHVPFLKEELLKKSYPVEINDSGLHACLNKNEL